MADLHVVVGAGGGAGTALVKELARRGTPVRAVTRRHRGDLPAGVEHVRGDASQVDSACAVCAGASVIYHCVNVPYARWDATLPGVMDALIEAAGRVGARLVYVDNLYMYGRVDGPLDETRPRAATGRKGRLRARLEDRLLGAHLAGRVRATIGRGSDFYGPDATNTVAGRLVFESVLAGRRAHWLGDLDVPHSLNYIEDFARGMITLATDDRALGEVWHVPAAPAITGREFIRLAFEAAGRPPKLGVHRRWALGLLAAVSRDMREVLEVIHQFERPFVLDGRKYTATFGDLRPTPHRDAVARTLTWYRDRTSQ